MRAPVSIIIPTLNAQEVLAECLAALAEGLEAGLIRELIVTDGGSGDDTLLIAEAAGAVIVTGPPGRGGQLARGVGQAQGDWLLVLHADCVLQPGWAVAVLGHIVDAPDRAGYFRLAFRARGAGARMVAGWANLRSRAFGLPYGDQGLLLSADLYADLGGYADIPLMEDVVMARRLRGRLVALDAGVTTSADRYLRRGWLAQGARNLWTQARFLAGADPARLAREYERR